MRTEITGKHYKTPLLTFFPSVESAFEWAAGAREGGYSDGGRVWEAQTVLREEGVNVEWAAWTLRGRNPP